MKERNNHPLATTVLDAPGIAELFQDAYHDPCRPSPNDDFGSSAALRNAWELTSARVGPKRRESTEGLDRFETYFLMKIARAWEVRWENLFKTGAISKWYSAIGNEALAVTAASALRAGDGLVTLHRDIGAILRYHVKPEELLSGARRMGAGSVRGLGESFEFLYKLACHLLGRADGFTGGTDRTYHMANVDRSKGILHIGMVSHLGAMIPVAGGVAWRLQNEGSEGVVLNFIGDGGTSTGDFHEGLNLAAVQRLPLVLVIENNHYAFSTSTREQYACNSLASRAAGYGIPGTTVDGCDVEAVYTAVKEAVDRARAGGGPSLIEADVPRMKGHSEGDDSASVIPEWERRAFQARDPVRAFEEALRDDGVIDDEDVSSLDQLLRELLIRVTDEAKAARGPDRPAWEVFAPATPGAAAEAEAEAEAGTGMDSIRVAAEATGAGATVEMTYLEGVRRALREEMARSEDVVLLGQDIAEFGGAFKVTKGLAGEFGKDRVVNTPIAESGTLGLAIGAAMIGQRPVVEMQFADFVSSCFNQIVNVAAKMHYRTGIPVPMVIRLPCGGGVGGGPFHSQSPEAWFTHTPGLKVVYPSSPEDAIGLLKAAIRDPNPVLFFEHKRLYRKVKAAVPEDEFVGELGKAKTVLEGRDVTVVTYGAMVHEALDAAKMLAGEGIRVEVVDLRTLVPLDEEAVLASVRRTGRLVVVQEASLTCGFGAEIVARVAEKAGRWLKSPPRRVAFLDTPVPFDKELESAGMPDKNTIADAIRRTYADRVR